MSEELIRVVREGKTEIDSYLKTMLDLQTKLEGNLNTSQKDFKQNLQKQKDDFVTELTNIVKDLNQTISKFSAEKNQALKKDTENLKRELTTIINTVKGEVQSSSATFESSMQSLDTETAKLLTTQRTQLSKFLDEIYTAEFKSLDGLKDSLTNSVDSLRSSYENSVEQEIENMKASTEDMYQSFMDSLTKFRNETNRITKVGEDKVSGTLDEAVQEIESGFENSISSLREIMQIIETKVSTVFKERQEEYNKYLKTLTGDLSTNIDKDLADIKNIMATAEETVNNFTKEESENFLNILSQSRSSFIDSMEINEKKLDIDVKNLNDVFRKELYVSLDNTSKKFQTFYESLQSWVNDMSSTIEKAKTEIEKSKTKLVDEPLGEVQAVGGRMEERITSYVTKLQQDYSSEKKRIQAEFETKLAKYQQEYSKHLDELNTNVLDIVKSSLDGQQRSYNTHRGQLSQMLVKSGQDAKSTMDKAFQSIVGDFREFADNQKQWQDSTSQSISRRLTDGKSRVVMELEGIVPQIVTLADNFRSTQDSQFKKAITAMDSAIRIFKKEDQDLTGQAHSLIDNLMTDISNRISTRKEDSINNIKKALADVETAQKTITAKLHEDIRTKFSNVVGRFVELESKVGDNTSKVFTTYSDSSDTFIESAKTKGATLTQTSNQAQDRFAQIQVKLDESLSFTSRNIGLQVQNVTEKCKQIVDSSNKLLANLAPTTVKRPTK